MGLLPEAVHEIGVVEMEGEEADEAGVSEDIDALRDGGEGLVEEVQMGLFGAGEGVEEGGGEGAGEVEDVGLQLRLNTATPT